MPTSPKHLRTVQRFVHLGGAVLLGTYLYSPWGEASLFTDLIRLVVMPILTLSGLAMWQQARLRRLLHRGRPGGP